MPECANCGSFVTRSFARVFGDNQDHVRGCIDCLSERELDSGVAARSGDEQIETIARRQ